MLRFECVRHAVGGVPCNARRKKSGSSVHEEVVESARDVIGISVGHELSGPINTDVARWPNSEERAFIWKVKPPPLNETARRRIYDLNKEKHKETEMSPSAEANFL